MLHGTHWASAMGIAPLSILLFLVDYMPSSEESAMVWVVGVGFPLNSRRIDVEGCSVMTWLG